MTARWLRQPGGPCLPQTSAGWAAGGQELTAGATRGQGSLGQSGGHTMANSRRSPRQSRQASSLQPGQQVQSTASLRLGRNRLQQRLAQLRQGGRQVGAARLGQGWLAINYPTKTAARPASPGARPERGMARWFPPGLPPSRPQIGVGVVGTAGAGAHRRHSQWPQPRPSNTLARAGPLAGAGD